MKVVFDIESDSQKEDLKYFLSHLGTQGKLRLSSLENQLMTEVAYSSMDILESKPTRQENSLDTAIFIPDKQTHVRINKEEIYHVEADGSYIKVFTKKRNFHVSSNLKTFNIQLKDSNFVRVSRKHLINVAHLHKIDGNTLYVGPFEIILSKNQRKSILDQFPILQTKLSRTASL